MGLFYSVRNSNSQPSVSGTGQFLRNQVGLDIREDQVYYRQRDTRFDSGSYLVLVPNIPDLGIKSASRLRESGDSHKAGVRHKSGVSHEAGVSHVHSI